MDFLTDEYINEHLDECLEIVKEMMQEYMLSEEEYRILTKEIMMTVNMAGGDFSEENIRFYATEYMKNNFLPRFKRAHGGY